MAKNSGEKNWFEWTVFAVGLVLTLGTVGVLVYQLVAQAERKPPMIEVRLGSAEPQGEHWAVPLTIENNGDETAEAVHVQATLQPPGGGKEETADFTIAFLPGHATREGWVTFRSDPNTGTLQARSLGYEKP